MEGKSSWWLVRVFKLPLHVFFLLEARQITFCIKNDSPACCFIHFKKKTQFFWTLCSGSYVESPRWVLSCLLNSTIPYIPPAQVGTSRGRKVKTAQHLSAWTSQTAVWNEHCMVFFLRRCGKAVIWAPRAWEICWEKPVWTQPSITLAAKSGTDLTGVQGGPLAAHWPSIQYGARLLVEELSNSQCWIFSLDVAFLE